MVNSTTPVNLLILSLFFLQPVFFNPKGDDVFHLAKNCFFLLFLLVLLLVWFVRRAEDDSPLGFKTRAFPLPVLFYVFSIFLSHMLSIHKPTSHIEMILTTGYFMWFVFFVHFMDVKNLVTRCLYLLSFSVFVSAIYGILQRSGIDFVSWSDASVRFRPSSAQGNPDFLGAFLAVSFPFIFYGFLKLMNDHDNPCRVKPGSALFLAVTLWFSFLSLLFASARASWLAWIAAMTVFLVFCPRGVYSRTWKFIAGLLLLFALTVFMVNRQDAPVNGVPRGAITERWKQTESAQVRLILWNDTLHLIRDAPLWGYGPATFALVYPRHRSVDILRIQAVTALPEDAHNEFLQKATTTGYFGLFAYLWLIFFVLLKITALRKSQPLYFAFLFSVFAGYNVQSLFNPRVPDLTLLFWFMTALSAGGRAEGSGSEEPLFFVPLPFSLSTRFLRMIFGSCVCMIIALLSIPWIVKPFIADMYYHKGELLLEAGNFEKAAFHFYFGMDMSPGCTKCRREFALCYKRVGELTGNKKILLEAIKEYEFLIKSMPYDASLYADMGRAYLVLASLDKKYFKQADANLKKAVSIDPKYPIFYNDLGIAYLNNGKYEEAKREFMKAKELVPEFFDAYQNLGVLYYKTEQLTRAISETQKAASLDASAAEPHANLALFFKDANRLHEAEKEIEIALKLFPGNKRYESLSKLISKKRRLK